MAGGFTFGAKQNSGIGSTTTSGVNFGGTNPAQPAFNFAANTQTPKTVGFALGQSQNVNSSFNFGTPQQGQNATSITATGTPQQGLTFANTTQNVQAANTGFKFGTPQAAQQPTQAASTGFSLGTPQSQGQPAQQTPSTGFNFGTPQSQQGQPAQQTPSTGFNFSTPQSQGLQTQQTPKTGFTVGAQQTQPAGNTSFNLGAQQQQIPAQQTVGTSFNLGAQQQQTSAQHNLGAQQTPAQQTVGTGFNLGTQQTTAQQTVGTGFNLGTQQTSAQQTGSTGPTLSAQQTQPQTASSFGGGTAAQTTAPTSAMFSGGVGQKTAPLLTVGAVAATPSTIGQTSTAGGGFNFGNTATPQSSTGFSLGANPASTPAAGSTLGVSTVAPTGLTIGGNQAATTATGLGTTLLTKPLTLGAATTAASAGFNLGTTTATGSLTLGAVKPLTTTSSGFGLGGLSGTSTAATSKPGLTFGTPSTSAASNFGGLGGSIAVTTATGIFSAGSTTTSTTGGIFGTTATSTTSTGLGGVDPKTTATGTGAGGVTGKPGDNKAVKETPVINEIQITVEEFKNYVKRQKSVREKILRMSSTPMFKVQEEVANLKQLLSHVSNGLQRNAVTISKLKQDSAMELKHAEIAHRTKETPPGLQYEHTAPTEYFQKLVDGFESQMVFYRQQIEEMENHLTSLNQGALLTPQELSLLLAKLHETFISLASQLQGVHEIVKAQKDHYLSYRRAFHGDDTDVFERRKKVKESRSSVVVTVGPSPFTSLSNSAATAMASTLNRPQQPAVLGLNTNGFGVGRPSSVSTAAGGLFGARATSVGSGFGFGTGATSQQTTGFGPSTGFSAGTTSNTATIRPLGSTGSSLFGSSVTGSQSTTGGQGLNQTNTGFGASATPASGGFGTSFGSQSANGTSTFQLQNPPLGSKRGKKQ